MGKKFTELSVRDLQAKRRGKPISKKRQPKDEEIDFTDIPKVKATQLKKARRVGRPLLGSFPRKDIHIRLDIEVLKKIKAKAKREGVKYQSLINAILKSAV